MTHIALDFDDDGSPATIRQDTTVAPGTPLAVRLVAKDYQAILGIEFTLTWNPARLAAQSYTPDAALALRADGAPGAGSLHAAQAVAGTGCLTTYPRFVGTLNFTAVGGGSYSTKSDLGVTLPVTTADCSSPPRVDASALVLAAPPRAGVAVPAALALHPVHPNPFDGAATVTLDLPTRAEVSVGIFDLRGALVRTLAAGPMDAGTRQIKWDGRDATGRGAGAGVYFVRVAAAGREITRSVVRLR